MMEPEALKFTESHEWVSVDGDEATIGITDHAQSEMNDIIYVELPATGTTLRKGDVFAVLESVKAAAEVNSPVSGEVIGVNPDLDGEPERINRDPFGDGWLVRVRMSDPSEVEGLMSHDEYRAMLGEG
ncbi:MAG TPA: glycine cleavage system protein GcvH [Thermoplasmata archaeon]|nr:glycine cleavage system protein GcvH [Thermoplasmata archaeon]